MMRRRTGRNPGSFRPLLSAPSEAALKGLSAPGGPGGVQTAGRTGRAGGEEDEEELILLNKEKEGKRDVSRLRARVRVARVSRP